MNRHGRRQRKHFVRFKVVEAGRQQVAGGKRTDCSKLTDMVAKTESPYRLFDENELRSGKHDAPALPFSVERLFSLFVQVICSM